MKIIFYMSISDFGVNLCSSFGFPESNSWLCWIQALFADYFTLAGWFWTTSLIQTIWAVTFRGDLGIAERILGILCWGWPAILVLVPLSTNTYSSDDEDAQWCGLHSTNRTPAGASQFWFFATYFAWLFICSGLMLFYIAVVYLRCLKYQSLSINQIYIKTYDRIYLYPIAMLVCWIPNCIIHFFDVAKHWITVTELCGISYGIFTTLIFIWKSPESRHRWLLYFKGLAPGMLPQHAEASIRLLRNISISPDFEDNERYYFHDIVQQSREESIVEMPHT